MKCAPAPKCEVIMKKSKGKLLNTKSEVLETGSQYLVHRSTEPKS